MLILQFAKWVVKKAIKTLSKYVTRRNNHSFFFWMVWHGCIINPSKTHLTNELVTLNYKYVDCVAMAFISLYIWMIVQEKIVLVFLSLIMSAPPSLTPFLLLLHSFPISKNTKTKTKFFLLLLAFRVPLHKAVVTRYVVSFYKILVFFFRRKNVSFGWMI